MWGKLSLFFHGNTQRNPNTDLQWRTATDLDTGVIPFSLRRGFSPLFWFSTHHLWVPFTQSRHVGRLGAPGVY